MGNGLELTFEGSGVCSPESAKGLAESYVQTLGAERSVQIAGPQPLAGKQVTGIPVPGHDLKPACQPQPRFRDIAYGLTPR